MRPRKTHSRPTDAEIEILNVLWKAGPATVRFVHEKISETKPSQYTTTLKLMQIMSEKGLVTRDEKDRTHVYAARWSQGSRSCDQTRRSCVRGVRR